MFNCEFRNLVILLKCELSKSDVFVVSDLRKYFSILFQIIPDDVAREKVDLLKVLGAEIESVRPRGIVDPRHVGIERFLSIPNYFHNLFFRN